MNKNNVNKSVTMRDVADHVGVSVATVSRTLRNPEVVSPAVRDKIAAAIESLGYLPDPAARALASTRSDIIGVILPSVSNNVFADVMDGIYSAVEGTHHSVQLGYSRYAPLSEENLIRVFLRQRPAGLIVAGIDQTEAAQALLREAGCPVVQIMETGSNPYDRMIGFSHYDAARAATAHLIAQGYRRPGFLGARMDPRTQRRLHGFRDELRAHGIEEGKRIQTTTRPSSVTLGSHLLAQLMDLAPETDAIFCINDDLALGAMFEAQRRNLRIPDDLGICGFNDMEMMAAAEPSISSVRTFRREMGEGAVQLILDALSGSATQEKIVDLGFQIIQRRSTRGH
ncbi:LacI family DNA-binding transcriptional regulator [Thioclava electrotropha]|uniref:LacI family DNA-binding transcriptional regulator n=1 Tax=Thioclava electrotropha TaxID=1549850 RepID=A0ABX6YSQ2_9RHOB|nr:LacI family DNA-binding transcriptional regulator [Thioclava electrotropha]QPZ90283.1 LacI family DNA-binding transcriptional regulator [Thioclava electrotropha]